MAKSQLQIDEESRDITILTFLEMGQKPQTCSFFFPLLQKAPADDSSKRGNPQPPRNLTDTMPIVAPAPIPQGNVPTDFLGEAPRNYSRNYQHVARFHLLLVGRVRTGPRHRFYFVKLSYSNYPV